MAIQVTATLPSSFGESGLSSPTGFNAGAMDADHIGELTSGSGITVDNNMTLAAGVTLTTGTGAVTIGSGGINTGVTAQTVGSGGIALPSTSTIFHSGGVAPIATTTGTELVAATTESYVVEMFIPFNCTITGIAILNATAVAGNIQMSLADTTGAIIAAAQTASTAASGTGAYQQVPFAVAYAAKAGRYFVVLQANNTGYKLRTHVLGNFTAGKLTGGTYGTFTTVASLIGTFVTGLGPICDTY